jgi:hypothetical protein
MWKPGIDYSVGTTADKTVLLESLADPSFRITATPDLAPGDVVVWEGDAEVYPDGTFSAMDNFRVSVSFETWGEQTVIAAPTPEPAPEPEPEPVKIKGPPAGKGWRK